MSALRQAGVIGWPVRHSLSPRIHGYWLRQYGISGSYERFAVEPAALHDFLGTLQDRGICGLNVTMPHKEAAFRMMDECDEAARLTSAVNTIVVREDGALEGSNTDGYGFLANLEDNQRWSRVTKSSAVILGAGGAARAIVAALVAGGFNRVIIANRTEARAQAIAADLGDGIEVRPWSARSEILEAANLLVNATSLGMTGNDALEIELDRLPEDAMVCDIVYAPQMTELLEHAGARGNPITGGIGMLLHQARPGFRSWFGVDPDVSDGLRRHVLEDVRA